MKQTVKKIADQILKQAAPPQKHVLTFQLDPKSLKEIEKILGDIKGFNDMTSNQAFFQVAITINSDVNTVPDFETELATQLRRSRPINSKLVLVKSRGGRPIRLRNV